ncbi:hypothetical protein NIES4071_58830 [Calothrix sp. NIES-4071]|nr:hypothetical protein NIES4071_58830 [Calothrix sp. NIES-4071]BAZ60190.1 hypothetical protein NIES4105_58780 [Calothrix sp. NIES-4105]
MEVQAKTRLLLALWDLGATGQEVKKGEVTRRIVTKGKKIADYQDVFKELEKEGAIIVSKKGYSLATPEGLESLSKGLRSSDFRFEGTIVGTWAANALLKWISEMNGAVASKSVSTNNVKSAIASYDEFKSEILDLFEKLDKGHVYGGLVPIWHLREALGERVNRHNFNDWMMEMQAEKLLYLQSGEHRGATKEQKDASIENEIRGLLFYASQPS